MHKHILIPTLIFYIFALAAVSSGAAYASETPAAGSTAAPVSASKDNYEIAAEEEPGESVGSLPTMIDSEISYDDVSATWGGDLMGLTAACKKSAGNSFGGRTVTVAVIDTGINASHEIFSGRLTGGKSFVDSADYDTDDNGHGTHIAGIIASNTPANVRIMPVKALNSGNKGTAQDVREAIEYAASNGADIINLSLGVSKSSFTDADGSFNADDYELYSSTLSGAVSYACSRGCIVITSAGNESCDISDAGSIPAGCGGSITVSALSHSESLYRKSNYGGAVDFCAPGEAIYSAYAGGSSSYEKLSGTSMAAPFISSAYAFLMLYNPDKASDPDYLTELLAGNCRDLGSSGTDRSYGRGLPVFEDGTVPSDRQERPVVRTVVCREDSITLKWDNEDSLSFDIFRKEEGETGFTKVGSTNENTYTDDTVTFNRSYIYYIETSDEARYSVSGRSPEVSGRAFIPVTGIASRTYNPYDLVLRPGEVQYLYAAALPLNASLPGLIWSSEDPSVAAVSPSGKVTAVGEGTTKITIRSEDESYQGSESYEITVVNAEKCGDHLYWHYDSDGQALVILGEGDMYDLDKIPWSDYTFRIKKIYLDKGVTSIGKNAFRSISVTGIEGLENVRRIGASAFNMFTCHGSFALPEYVEIADTAFYKAVFDTFTIPADLQVNDSFFMDNDFGKFEISGESSAYSVQDGVLFNKDGSRLIRYPFTPSGSCSIPDSVTSLSAGAFKNCRISSVQIPGTVSSLPESVFESCSRLEEAEIPGSVTRIGGKVFYGCTIIASPELSPKLTYIGPHAFYGTRFTDIEIPASLGEIGDYALFRMRVTQMRIPEGITSLGSFALSRTTLSELYLPGSLKKIGANCFNDSFYSTDIHYNGFTSNFNAIEGQSGQNYNESTLIIDTGGDTGGLTWSAYGESGHVTLTISGNGRMPDYETESDCPWSDGRKEIEKVVIEDGVTYLGKNSLCQMPNLISVELPADITDTPAGYGYGLFLGDAKLENFICDAADGEPLSVLISYLYAQESGTAYEPSVIVRTADGTELDPESDCTVTCQNTSAAGQGTVRIDILTGEKRSIYLPFLVIAEKLDGTDIRSLSSISLYPDVFVYDGKSHIPNVVVKSGSYTLNKGSDYRLSFPENCVEPGRYRVVATGIGAYTGTRSAYFVIRENAENDSAGGGSTVKTDHSGKSDSSNRGTATTGSRDAKTGDDSKHSAMQIETSIYTSKESSKTGTSAYASAEPSGETVQTEDTAAGRKTAGPQAASGTEKEPSPEEKAPAPAQEEDSASSSTGRLGFILFAAYFLILIFFVALHRE